MRRWILNKLVGWLLRPGLKGIDPAILCRLKHDLVKFDARKKVWKKEEHEPHADCS